ncbi:MAG: AAA family ATPase, partial [Pirellulales bacterium]
MNSLEKVLSALGDSNYKQRGDTHDCICPSHDDGKASLSVTYNPLTKSTLIDCKAGCSTIDVLNALGLKYQDLFDDAGSAPPAPAPKKKATRHATHEKAIAAVRWSVEQNGETVAETIPYLYENGQPFGYNVRFNFVEGGKTFRQIHRDGDAWLSGAGKNLWCLYRLNDIPADGPIYIHEGEKACESGIKIGLCSTCCKGGSKAPKQSDWSPLAGRDVVILPDNDDAGEGFAAEVTEILHQLVPPASVKIVRLDARPSKGGDLADIVADCQDNDELIGLRQEIEDLAADTEPEKITAPKNSAREEKSSDPSGPRLLVRMFDEIEERETNWLWKNRIIIGGLTIVTGPVGNTKSTFCIDLAARVSLGQRHPDNSGMCPDGEVLWFGHEDAPNEIMKPRLVASGANCSKIGFVDGVVSAQDGDDPEMAQRLRLEAEIDLLRETLQHMPGVKMLVFDPLPEFIGGDHNSAAEVRSALMPLNKLAQEFGIAVVAVCHQNKKQGLSAVQTIAGSGGFTQVARTVLCVINDPDDEDKTATRRRFMVVAKSNYGGMGQAQAYRLSARKNDQMAVEWESFVFDDIDSEDLIKRSRTNEDGRRNTVKRDAAVDDMHQI